MTPLTWENGVFANGPALLAWLDEEDIPVAAYQRRAWSRPGAQARVDALDRILTCHGRHLWMVPDHVWERRHGWTCKRRRTAA